MTPTGARPTHPFTVRHRDVWSIALPATLAFTTEPLAGLVDLTVIGRLGDAGLLAGVVLGGVAFAMFISLVTFLRLGTAGLTAQAVGAKDQNEGLVHLVRAVLLGASIGTVMIVFSAPISWLAALFLAPGPASTPAYETYFGIRLWSAPFATINFALLGWFYGRAKATTGMWLQMLIHGLNVVFSIILVQGFGMAVAGVAFGTLIGEVVAALVGLWLAARYFGGFKRLFLLVRPADIVDARALGQLFSLSRDLMIRSGVLMFTFAWFTARTSRMGDVTLAANELLLYFMLITAFFLDGQAQAAEQLCGKAVGANHQPAFDRAVKLTHFWGLGIGFALFVFWLFSGPLLIDFMTTNADIRAEARLYLFWAALTAFTGVIPFVLDGVMQGATLGAVIRNGMVASAAIYVVAALILEPLYGVAGLWAAIHIFFVARAAIFWVAVQRAKPALFDG
jgi:MATE family, multidrug efflux pump